MDIATVEDNVKHILGQEISPNDFLYQLLGAYGQPQSSITRLRNGGWNSAKNPGEIFWKKHLHFVASDSVDLALIDKLSKSDEAVKHKLRFVMATDFKRFLAVDRKTMESLDIPLAELADHADFFLPWAGREKHRHKLESHADRRAAERMGKLYNQICHDNPNLNAEDTHHLNVFLARLLFCFFAESSEIFETRGMFTAAIDSHTQDDGSDLSNYLGRLFEIMNIPEESEKRKQFPSYTQLFPYVNGGLFENFVPTPRFSKASRDLIINCGSLDWSEINPDIFGSMMQAVVRKTERGKVGMHYTSVSNIMKVIQPLFLNELESAFKDNFDNVKGLERLLTRLYKIRIFDPACGSGNFLIIAYKELRNLEMRIYERLRDIHLKGSLYLPRMLLTQFAGIEVEDFAHEIAILSMWLAEHQMNVKFKAKFGGNVPTLPLKPHGNIQCGNANLIDWNTVCPKKEELEIYVLGNPPYLGARNQSPEQKRDVGRTLGKLKGSNNLDYIACWFYKGAEYIKDANAKFAFVSTNSICQGEQVSLIWPHILYELGLEIGFCHQSFKWENNAKNNAGVTVVIIGIQNKSSGKKALYGENSVQLVDNISPYLIPGKNIVVYKAAKPIFSVPAMCFGSMANDAGHLLLSAAQMNEILSVAPEAKKYIRRMYGADEFIDGGEAYCLWINDRDVEDAKEIPSIARRIQLVKSHREKSTRGATNKLATVAHRFGEIRHLETNAVIIPCHSSERRDYIPIGFLESDSIINNAAQAIYNAELWIFAIITSRLHNVWARIIGGALENRIRYSSGIVYNTFPFRDFSDKDKEVLTLHALNVMTEREKHSEKTIAELYDPKTMPMGLKQAHSDLDAAVERLYRTKPFLSDQQRIEFLLDEYSKNVTLSGVTKTEALK